jgi:hypothetical protein
MGLNSVDYFTVMGLINNPAPDLSCTGSKVVIES